MKTLHRNFWMLGIALMSILGFTSCEYDYDQGVGYNVSGHWFGDMDMWIGNEKARGSEIEFNPVGWGYSYGRGVEVDYYRYGTMTHYFDYQIRNGVIYLTFDDPALDCTIFDYSLGYSYFRGYIANPYGENESYFSLRNYDRYWNDYGYGSYYYAKEDRMADAWNDSTLTDSTLLAPADTTAAPKCYRGVNMKQN